MSEVNIFEQASRKKLTFSLPGVIPGVVGVSQLWDMPLTVSSHGLSLDAFAIHVDKEINESRKSFVNEEKQTSSGLENNELRLSIIKHIIKVKKEEAEQAVKKASKESEIHKLKRILKDREEEALKDLTPEEIKARLEELESSN